MKRIVARGVLALIVILAVLLYVVWTPDIAHDTLAAKYAGGASRFVTLPSGARAHYRIQGDADGVTLVLLHGSNSSLHAWEPWVAELGDAHRIVTVDLPGHGLTGATPAADYTFEGMARFVEEFTRKLGLSRFILGGNSMGGAVTLSYALDHPDELSGIVLVSAGGTQVPAEVARKVDMPLAFRLAGHWYTDWLLTSVTPRAVVADSLEHSIVKQSIIDDAMIDRYWELNRYPGNRRAMTARFAWYWNERVDLPVERIAAPALILWGTDDRLVPVEAGRLMRDRIPKSELVEFPGVGHVAMEEVPAESAAAVRAFIARHSL
jgi:pimeloyl-ACP methyl ester carboxylesterase